MIKKDRKYWIGEVANAAMALGHLESVTEALEAVDRDGKVGCSAQERLWKICRSIKAEQGRQFKRYDAAMKKALR